MGIHPPNKLGSPPQQQPNHRNPNPKLAEIITRFAKISLKMANLVLPLQLKINSNLSSRSEQPLCKNVLCLLTGAL